MSQASHERETTGARTFRLPRSVLLALEKEARDRDISLNALVSKALQRYTKYEQFAEKLQLIRLSQSTIRLMLDGLEDEELTHIGAAMGARVPKEVIIFLFKDANLHTYFEWLKVTEVLNEFASYDVQQNQQDYVIAFHHQIGMKWSIFLKAYEAEAVRSILHRPARAEALEDLIVLRFPVEGVDPETTSAGVSIWQDKR